MTAAENMALDDTLLELKGLGQNPDTINIILAGDAAGQSHPITGVGITQAV